MIHSDLISFFKECNLYEEELFNYLNKHTFHFDYGIEENRVFTGFFPGIDKDGVLKKFMVSVPFVVDEITMLINIHEYTHAIENYYRLGKKYKKDKFVEVLPMMFELLYIKKHPSKELEEYENHLNSCITRNNEEYLLGAKMQEILADSFKYENIKQLKRKVRKLGKKIDK